MKVFTLFVVVFTLTANEDKGIEDELKRLA